MEENNQIWMVIPKPELEELKGELQEIKNLFLKTQEDTIKNRWVESEEARRQLGVCQRTWQRMRDDRIIPFSQFGRKILVRQSDIETFLEDKVIKAK